MQPQNKSLATIKEEIARYQDYLDQVHTAREQVRGYTAVPLEKRGEAAKNTYAMLLATASSRRTFKMLAQGDSWFDYPPGKDIIGCLHEQYGHAITNIAVAGSTLNDEAYGPVPRELFGLPFGPKQSDDPDRITELVNRIIKDKPQGLLLSAGGNDVAGDEFFSFINNARSGLPSVNAQVVNGVVNSTFKSAYQYLIETALAADTTGTMKVFTHGYDYPWPDGRGVIQFLGWKVGPWFDPSFNQKNYPYDGNNPDVAMNGLQARHDIIVQFIDALNVMLASMAADPIYGGKLIHVDLRKTLFKQEEWANELHPVESRLCKTGCQIDDVLQKYL